MLRSFRFSARSAHMLCLAVQRQTSVGRCDAFVLAVVDRRIRRLVVITIYIPVACMRALPGDKTGPAVRPSVHPTDHGPAGRPATASLPTLFRRRRQQMQIYRRRYRPRDPAAEAAQRAADRSSSAWQLATVTPDCCCCCCCCNGSCAKQYCAVVTAACVPAPAPVVAHSRAGAGTAVPRRRPPATPPARAAARWPVRPACQLISTVDRLVSAAAVTSRPAILIPPTVRPTDGPSQPVAVRPSATTLPPARRTPPAIDRRQIL